MATIRRWLKKIENNDTKPKPKTGRPKAIGKETQEKMLDYLEEDRCRTAADIYRNSLVNHKQVSKSTIERMLNNEGLFARIAIPKPKISEINIEKRMAWAKKHEKWTSRNWNQIFFSDECKLFPEKGGKLYVRKKEEENWTEEKFMVQESLFHGGLEIMIWGCICSAGPVDLIWLHSSLTSEV